MPRRTVLRRLAAQALLAFFLYQSVLGVAVTWGYERAVDWPNVPIFQDLFYMYGVFGLVQERAWQYVAFGSERRLRAVPRRPLAAMRDLDFDSYYPQPRGDAHRRQALRGYGRSRRRQSEAYGDIADVLERVHNERHPDATVEQVFLYVSWWPVDGAGYEHRKDEREFYLLGHN